MVDKHWLVPLKQITPAYHDTHELLSDGEIYYLWYFMQGTIMNPFVRSQLRRSWGFCQRHYLAWLIVESSFHHNFMHGPSILMADLIELARNCLTRNRLPWLAAMHLRGRKDCFMCALGYNLQSKGYAMDKTLARGREVDYLLQFADETELYWRDFICPRCNDDKNNVGGVLCRLHLVQEILHNGYTHISREREFIRYLAEQIKLFARSFRWEFRSTETDESRAALILATGWTGGWVEFIRFYNRWRR